MAKDKNINLKKVQEVIERATGEEAKVIAVPSQLIHFVGNITERGKTQKAVFLSQLIYWSDKGKRQDGFIYKTQRQWKAETGLSETQIADYTEEFENLGLLETKLKKANGSPTTHYKLKLEVFLNSFDNFLQNGISDNRENQSEEGEDSLTENTTQITTEISTTSYKNRNFIDEEDIKDKDFNVKENILAYYANRESDEVIDGLNLADEILIPANFAPTWDKQFRAIMDFPEKPLGCFTEKFVEKFRQTELKLTLFEWNNRWRDWLGWEGQVFGYSPEKLEKEHLEIYMEVLTKIYGFPKFLKLKIMHRSDFHQKFEKFFSEPTIN